MPLSVVRSAVEMVRRSPLKLPNDTLHVLWHAGEPLLADVDYYKRATDEIRSAFPNVRIRQTFQTNGTLLSDQWCEFFNGNDADIGISIDGPKHFHDQFRRRRGKQGSYDATMRGLHLLQKHRVPHGVLAVLTKNSVQAPDELFQFFQSEKINDLAFNIEEIEGANVHSTFCSSIVKATSTVFFQTLFALNRAANYPIRIREFEQSLFYIREYKRRPEFKPSQSEQRPFALLIVDVNGNVTTYSPELATIPAPNRGKFAIGNVLSSVTITDLANSVVFKEMSNEIEAGISRCKNECSYFSFCGGGSPSSKYFESNSFDITQTDQCIHYRQAVVDATISHLASS